MLYRADWGLPEPSIGSHMAISSITAHITSEMDSCCWEPEVPAITEPSHPFTRRSMGQLLKRPSELCVIQPRRFNCFGRALTPLPLTWARVRLLRAILTHLGCLFGRWTPRSDQRPGPVSRIIKVGWCRRELLNIFFWGACVLSSSALINRWHGDQSHFINK